MLDPFSSSRSEVDIRPVQKLQGKVEGLFTAEGDDFRTLPVNSIPLTLEGIPADFLKQHG